MHAHVDVLLRRLESVSETYRSGNRPQSWTADCPCSGGSPNPHVLDIGLDLDDRILLFCQAGCSVDAILHALSLRPSDLRPAVDAIQRSLFHDGDAAASPLGLHDSSIDGDWVGSDPPVDKNKRQEDPSALLFAAEVRDAIASDVPILLLESAVRVWHIRHQLHAGGPLVSASGGPTSSSHATPSLPFCPTAPPHGLTAWRATHRDSLCGAQVWLALEKLDENDSLVSRICDGLTGIVTALKIARLSGAPFPLFSIPGSEDDLPTSRREVPVDALVKWFDRLPYYYQHDASQPEHAPTDANSTDDRLTGLPTGAFVPPNAAFIVDDDTSAAPPAHDPQECSRMDLAVHPRPCRLSSLVRWLEERGVDVVRPSDGVAYLIVPASLPTSPHSAPPDDGEQRALPAPGLHYAYPLPDSLGYRRIAPAFFRESGLVPSLSEFRDACFLLNAGIGAPRPLGSRDRDAARPRAAPRLLTRRVGFLDGMLYVDLADEGGRVVSVDDSGWRYARHCPIAFIRTTDMLPLPHPQEEASLDSLRDLLDLSLGPTWAAIRAWIVGVLFPYGPVPPLLMQCEDAVRLDHLSYVLSHLLDPHLLGSVGLSQSPSQQRVGSYAQPLIVRAALRDTTSTSALDAISLPISSGSGRVILTDTAQRELSPDLRRQCLVVRPDAASGRTGLRSPLPALDPPIHTALLGALLDAVVDALRGYSTTEEPTDVEADEFAPFVRWVAAAEAPGLAADAGFHAFWRDGAGQTSMLHRGWQALRRRFTQTRSNPIPLGSTYEVGVPADQSMQD